MIHNLCMRMGIFSICGSTYFYILPSSNSKRIFQCLVTQNMDISNLYSIDLSARTQNKQVKSDNPIHMFLLDHLHKNHLDSWLHTHKSSYLHTKQDFKDIFPHIAKSNYRHMNPEDNLIHMSSRLYQQMNRLDNCLHKMLLIYLRKFP